MKKLLLFLFTCIICVSLSAQSETEKPTKTEPVDTKEVHSKKSNQAEAAMNNAQEKGIAPVGGAVIEGGSNISTAYDGHTSSFHNGSFGNAFYGESNDQGTITGGALGTYSRAMIAGYQDNPLGQMNTGLFGNVTGLGSSGYGIIATHGPNFVSPITYAAFAGPVYSGLFMGGNVGIGTSTPNKILDINNTTANSANLIDLQNSSASGYTTIDFADNTGAAVMGFGYANPSAAFLPGNAYLDVKGGNDFLFLSESVEKMRMTTDGKLRLTKSTGNEMVIINDDIWNHFAGDQDFGNGGNYFIMASNEGSGESGGIYGDGDLITLWSPGDGNGSASGALLAVLDEDWYNGTDTDPYNDSALKWYLTELGGWIASDIDRKENIQTYSNSLDKITALDVFTYNYKLAPSEIAKGQVNPEVVGIIAQDLYEVIPQAVNITPDGEHFINYNQVTPVLIGAVKELTEENNELKERLATLEAAVQALAKK